MRYHVFLFTVMIFTTAVVFAQDEEPTYEDADDDYSEETGYVVVNPGEVSQKKGYHTEPIDVKRFDPKKWERVVGGEDYSETRARVRKKQSQADSTFSQSSASGKRFQRGDPDEEEEPQDSISLGPIASPLLTIIVYTLAIGIIGYILFLIIKNVSLKSRAKVSKAVLPDQPATVEDIKELEIDRLLREAIAAGNYRLVVRIYFLGLLQKLDEDGFIVWKKDKTNKDYLSELFSRARYYDEVKTLTFVYEQVWYGDHNLPVQTYDHIISSFKAIDQKLKASKAQ
jgi:hypothetical protein